MDTLKEAHKRLVQKHPLKRIVFKKSISVTIASEWNPQDGTTEDRMVYNCADLVEFHERIWLLALGKNKNPKLTNCSLGFLAIPSNWRNLSAKRAAELIEKSRYPEDYLVVVSPKGEMHFDRSRIVQNMVSYVKEKILMISNEHASVELKLPQEIIGMNLEVRLRSQQPTDVETLTNFLKYALSNFPLTI